LRAGELQNILRQAGAEIPEDLLKFGSTVKKKVHDVYGAHFKPELQGLKSTKVSFESDDE